MGAFRALSLANLKSFLRDRAALFWTLAFPVTFVILFGTILSGGGNATFDLGWVDQDGSQAASGLHSAFAAVNGLKLHDGSLADEQAAMKKGDVAGIIVVPSGLGAAVAASSQGTSAAPVALTVYTDPSRSTAAQTISQIANAVVSSTNLALTGKSPVLAVTAATIQTQQLSTVSYIVPSILAMALMQLGVFASIPLVQQREKLILKRLNATPLPRWTLVASNIVVRLVLAAAQTALIVGIGIQVFGIGLSGGWLEVVGLVALGAVTFVSIGYVIASYARTEDTANTLASVVQFPLMFLSGIFFPIAFMPQWLQPVAALLPLTYLGDALRQTMVGGAAYAPLYVDVLVLSGWLIVTFLISARYFRWQ